MTSAEAPPILDERLVALERAVAAGRLVGLTDEAEQGASVLARARQRLGFPGATYLLALAGGTGVGKSSILNALAGVAVSEVRAVRPTTDRPIAWVGDERRAEVAPLLEWLGIDDVRSHSEGRLPELAVIDLPDMDSMRTEHQARVDELLPRIDATAWVVDPEKYDDERVHAYLRRMAIHAPRLRIILNKSDRLTDTDRSAVADDLRARLEADGIRGAPIHVVSAVSGAGIDELQRALAAEADAKAIVAAKLTADADVSIRRLADAAGIGADGETRALLSHDRRDAAIREAQAGALALVDPDGLARQAQGAVLGRARRIGGGLLGRTVQLLSRLGGLDRRRADPAAYLGAWRRRGTLGRALNPVRAALTEAVASVPPASRPGLMVAVGAGDAEAALGRAIDEATGEVALEAVPPGSFLWPIIGLLQLIAAAVLLLAIAWYATLFLMPGIGPPAATVDLPLLGPIPMPLALLAGSLLASFVLGAVLTLHAGWIGRRFARRVTARVRERIAQAVATESFGPLDRVEAARREIAAALPSPGAGSRAGNR